MMLLKMPLFSPISLSVLKLLDIIKFFAELTDIDYTGVEKLVQLQSCQAMVRGKNERNEMKNETLKLNATLNRETEKAVLMDCEIDTNTGLSHAKVWFPKSRTELCEGGIEIESWLYNAKADEMNGNFICFIELAATAA